MDTPRELVDAGQVGAVLVIVSGVCLPAAVVALALRRGRPQVRRVGLAALAGALLWPMWRLFNAIEDALGLDSIAALALNAAIFLAVGLGFGLLVRRLEGRDRIPAGPTPAAPES